MRGHKNGHRLMLREVTCANVKCGGGGVLFPRRSQRSADLPGVVIGEPVRVVPRWRAGADGV